MSIAWHSAQARAARSHAKLRSTLEDLERDNRMSTVPCCIPQPIVLQRIVHQPIVQQRPQVVQRVVERVVQQPIIVSPPPQLQPIVVRQAPPPPIQHVVVPMPVRRHVRMWVPPEALAEHPSREHPQRGHSSRRPSARGSTPERTRGRPSNTAPDHRGDHPPSSFHRRTAPQPRSPWPRQRLHGGAGRDGDYEDEPIGPGISANVFVHDWPALENVHLCISEEARAAHRARLPSASEMRRSFREKMERLEKRDRDHS